MGYPIVHFEIIGSDTPKLREFYRDAFDWKVEQMPAEGGIDYAMVYPQGEQGLNGGIGAGMDPTQSYVSVYVGVPNLEEMLSKIQSLGGSTMMPPMQVPNGPRIAMFKDPGGHLIGLVQTDTMRS